MRKKFMWLVFCSIKFDRTSTTAVGRKLIEAFMLQLLFYKVMYDFIL